MKSSSVQRVYRWVWPAYQSGPEADNRWPAFTNAAPSSWNRSEQFHRVRESTLIRVMGCEVSNAISVLKANVQKGKE